MASSPSQRPQQDARYRPCGACARCRTGVGRDQNPAVSDCWDDYLTAATTQRSA
ncbi:MULTISPECIES: hypothetical protein [Kitasatospora]|uniref:hypothetical protein n=1 Tax=Kitasatospora TaxID=2063 RepID=UPI0012FEA84A|nr:MULTISPECIES: hypothetical protein [Kitasatospora]